MKKHLTSILDLELEEILKIFKQTQDVKKNPEGYKDALRGKMFGLIFEKPSTRTWISFQTGIAYLGGGTIYLGPEDMKLGIREEVKDVARVLDRYLGGIVMRTFSHQTITEFGKYFHHPIINGLSNFEHPCQALTDFFTIQEKLPNVERPTVAFVGDGNNVLNSLLLLGAKLGVNFRYATPKQYSPDSKVVKQAQELAQKSGAVITGGFDPAAAVRDADVIYTDVWISMGEEKIRKQKLKAFKGMQINMDLVRKAKPQALVMHCLPAHRGEEITDEVIESKNSVIFDQAENRLHVQKAILLHLFS